MGRKRLFDNNEILIAVKMSPEMVNELKTEGKKISEVVRSIITKHFKNKSIQEKKKINQLKKDLVGSLSVEE